MTARREKGAPLVTVRPGEATTRKPNPTTSPGSWWRDKLAIHPAANAYPLLAPDELQALADDIASNGVRLRPVVWLDPKTKKWSLIDGRNRLDALGMLGEEDLYTLTDDSTFFKECGDPADWLGTATSVDPVALIQSLNLHRRHLTPEQRRQLIADALKADSSKTDRAIAKDTGTHPNTVGAVRADLKANVQIVHKADRVEASGRKARGAKPKATNPVEEAWKVRLAKSAKEAEERLAKAKKAKPTLAGLAELAQASLTTYTAEELITALQARYERGGKDRELIIEYARQLVYGQPRAAGKRVAARVSTAMGAALTS
jgi:hypothetical protein